jgi:hypothetical protein
MATSFPSVATRRRSSLNTSIMGSLWAVSGAPVRHTDVLVRSGCKGRFRYSDLKEAGRAAEAYVV